MVTACGVTAFQSRPEEAYSEYTSFKNPNTVKNTTDANPDASMLRCSVGSFIYQNNSSRVTTIVHQKQAPKNRRGMMRNESTNSAISSQWGLFMASQQYLCERSIATGKLGVRDVTLL